MKKTRAIIIWHVFYDADMVELVDALDLESSGVTRAGSSPVIRTQKKWHIRHFFFFSSCVQSLLYAPDLCFLRRFKRCLKPGCAEVHPARCIGIRFSRSVTVCRISAVIKLLRKFCAGIGILRDK